MLRSRGRSICLVSECLMCCNQYATFCGSVGATELLIGRAHKAAMADGTKEQIVLDFILQSCDAMYAVHLNPILPGSRHKPHHSPTPLKTFSVTSSIWPSTTGVVCHMTTSSYQSICVMSRPPMSRAVYMSCAFRPPDQHEVQEPASYVNAGPRLPPADSDPHARPHRTQVVCQAAPCSMAIAVVANKALTDAAGASIPYTCQQAAAVVSLAHATLPWPSQSAYLLQRKLLTAQRCNGAEPNGPLSSSQKGVAIDHEGNPSFL